MLTNNVIPFLSELSKNNNKIWFDDNKSWYTQAMADFKRFIDELIPQLSVTDKLLVGTASKECVFRIYRDVRFSKDKTPYKSHFGASIAPGGRKSRHAGFYLHIEPIGGSFTGGGLYRPESPYLKALRTEFYSVPDELEDVINDKEFKKYFNELWDDKLKLAPKGFPKDFKYIDLLKFKSYVGVNYLSMEQIQKPDFQMHLIKTHKALYPLNRLLNAVLGDAGLL